MKSYELVKKLTGTRIYLRQLVIDDAETIFNALESDRNRISEYLPWPDFIQSVEDEKKYIQSTHERWTLKNYFDYGIFKTETNEYIGNIGVHSINWNNNLGELGYWLLGDYEGFGYMSDAVKLIETYLFKSGFNRIQIKCSDMNLRSESVPKRCGYIFEGINREDRIFKGSYRNTKVFSKLASEFSNDQS